MPDIPLTPDLTVAQVLDRGVALYPDSDAVISGDQTISYASLGAQTNALAAGLARLGVGRGDRVAMILPNSLAFVQCFFGVGRLGATIVPLNPLDRPHELAHVLADSESSVAIIAPRVRGNDIVEALTTMRAELPALRHVVVTGEAVPAGMLSYTSVMAAGEGADPLSQANADDLFGLIYTSGTTGVPKGAMHTHRTILSPALAADNVRRAMFERPSLGAMARMARTIAPYAGRFMKWGNKPQTMLNPAPMHGLSGFSMMFTSVVFGYRYVVTEFFHPARVLETIEREHVNVFAGSPTMFSMMLGLPNFDEYDKSSLLYCAMGSAPCPPPLVKEVRQRFGCPVVISFGATETSGAALITRMDDSSAAQSETVGRAVADTEIKIVDEARRPLPDGEVGELACRMGGVMLGYYRAPQATAEALDADGWYYTGDLAVRDAKGYVRIVGRKKDLIIRGGQNVYPAEIEALLLALDAVEQAAVVGVPDELGGERVWVFAVPKQGHALASAEIMKVCRRGLAPHKVPDEVRIVEELPLTASGKVVKYRLREQALIELGRDPHEDVFAGPAAG